MSIQTGSMIDANVQLALYRFYVDASDRELQELGVTREDVLALARSIEDRSDYRSTELATIATKMIAAYRAGRKEK